MANIAIAPREYMALLLGSGISAGAPRLAPGSFDAYHPSSCSLNRRGFSRAAGYLPERRRERVSGAGAGAGL